MMVKTPKEKKQITKTSCDPIQRQTSPCNPNLFRKSSTETTRNHFWKMGTNTQELSDTADVLLETIHKTAKVAGEIILR